jgi:hypothetical protein
MGNTLDGHLMQKWTFCFISMISYLLNVILMATLPYFTVTMKYVLCTVSSIHIIIEITFLAPNYVLQTVNMYFSLL